MHRGSLYNRAARAFVLAALLGAIGLPVALPVGATTTAPTLVAHSQYGGLTAKNDAFVNLLAGTSTTIAASPANTAPELLHSNINLKCANGQSVNTGMPGITLILKAGHSSFLASFVRKAIEAVPTRSS